MINIYKFHIITLGCRVNQYESKAISEGLYERGLIESQTPEDCDLYIINTCTVTAESSRKSRQMIRRAASYNKDAVIIVAGCYSDIAPSEVEALNCTDLIIGTANKTAVCDHAIELLKSRKEERISRTVIYPKEEYDQYTVKSSEKARAYLKIEDGCNGKCAYCIISKARGPVRSKLPDLAYDEACNLASNGVKEIILTGIEISGYQYDLISLIKRISLIPGIERIRLGSLDPSMLTEENVKKLSEIKKLMPHFHLSIQSGCSRILALMRRKYNAEMALNAIYLLKKHFKNLMLTADLIVGFPGETEEDFVETIEFLKNAEFLHVHIFPYSVRPDTEAATMKGQLPKSVKDKRLQTAQKLQDEIASSLLDSVVKEQTPIPILFESESDGILTGHSDNFIEVKAKGCSDLISEIVSVVPTSYHNGVIEGTII